MAQYYCLVAGLVDYGFDADKKSLNWEAIRSEIMETLTKRDRALIEQLMGLYDVKNIVECVSQPDGWRYSPMGTISKKGIGEIAPLLSKSETYDPELHNEIVMPKFVAKALRIITDSEWAEEQGYTKDISLDTLLYSLYFETLSKTKGFVAYWSKQECTIRNISAAFNARRLGVEQGRNLIGDGYIVQQLSTSIAPDFGLKGEIPYLEQLLTILAGDNIVKKERDMDMLRLSLIEERNLFSYFNVDTVLGYYLKIAMIDRWLALDATEGREIFEKIVKGLSTIDYSEKLAEESK